MSNIGRFIVKDSEFEDFIYHKVWPFMQQNAQEDYVMSEDGTMLHYQYLLNAMAKGTIVISHGFCEFTTKYYETMYYFYLMGYSVFIVEHRGHGYSDRQVEGYSKVHIQLFEEYIDDFDSFVGAVREKTNAQNLYLFAHSMGGAIGAYYLEEHPDVFEKAVLSSPMIQMSTGSTSPFIVKLMTLMSYIPFCEKNYIPGYHDYNSDYKYPQCGTMSEARYKYQFDERERCEMYHMNGGTLGWCREAMLVTDKILAGADRVQIPVLLFQAGLDHLVMPEGQNEFAKRSGNTKLIVVPDSKHEIMNATDEIIYNYYDQVMDFYG